MNFTDQFTNYDFPKFGYVRLPQITLNKEELDYLNIDKDITNEQFLKQLILKGYNDRGFKQDNKEYFDRLNREYDTVVDLGFTDYFLLVWRVCRFCEANKIMRDYGRGSAAGSLMFYCINVTEIDPLRYSLYFERFISKTRSKKKIIDGVTYIDGSLAPDVDLDVDPTKRHLVVEFLNSLYPNRMCKILNMSELSGKVLIKECGKIVEDIKENEMMEISNLIPKRFGIVSSISDARDEEPAFKKWCDEHPEAYNIALQISNLFKNASVHASGYVISYDELLDIMPLCLTKDKELASCYTMSDVSSLCVKLDILGSRVSAVIDDTCRQINLDWKTVNVDSDPYIYDNLKFGLRHSHGVFQIESETCLRVNNQICPKNLSELSDMVAIARPGALSFLEKYVKNSNDKVHPLFDDILAKTRYVCLYQEQAMSMSKNLGFSLEDGEQIRRVIGKKKVEEVKEWKEKIYHKCEENKHPKELADLLWKIIDDSAKYQFNASHSYSFASLAALTIYLKYKFPLNFYIALLNQAKNEPDPLLEINIIQHELADFGIRLLPPSLSKSELDFTIEGNNIRFGLGSLRGISDKTIEKLLSFRKEYQNRFEMFEAAIQAKINIGVLSSIIQSGCLGTDIDRSALVYEAQLYRLLTDNERKYVHAIHAAKPELIDLRSILNYMIKNKNDKGKPYIKDSRLETIKKRLAPFKEIYNKNSGHEKLAIYYYEKQNIGYPYTYNLREINPEYKDMLQTVYDVKNKLDNNESIFSVVEVMDCVKKTSKKGTVYMKMTAQDETGNIELLAFNNQKMMVDLIMEDNGGALPKSGDIVFIKGKKKDENTIFLDRCDIQTFKIYTKLADLKNDYKDNED